MAWHCWHLAAGVKPEDEYSPATVGSAAWVQPARNTLAATAIKITMYLMMRPLFLRLQEFPIRYLNRINDVTIIKTEEDH
jgi:hypothetical protein